MQKVLGCFQKRLAYSEEPMEDIAGEKEVTALSTSLAWSLWPRGQQILIYLAVEKCMLKQYWSKK
jgi:hypothetical protein